MGKNSTVKLGTPVSHIDLQTIGYRTMNSKELVVPYITDNEKEWNTYGGPLQDDGVLVDIVGEGGSWVKNRDGQARVQVNRVSWWGINVTRDNLGIGKSCV